MRIIGNIEHGVYKITVFKMEDRVSIKFEDGLTEYVMKFRAGAGVDNLEQAQEFVDDSILRHVDDVFTSGHSARNERHLALLDKQGIQFPKII